MQKGHSLQFACRSCKNSVAFSVFSLESSDHTLRCEGCQRHYVISDAILRRQIKKFEELCRAIHEAEEILGLTHVGIDVGERRVKVPYKLLLTRLSSQLDLMIDNEPLTIQFRIEPIKDVPPHQTHAKSKG